MNIIDNMPQLKKFIFNIRSITRLTDQIDFPTNEDMQHTFKDFENNQIITYVSYLPNNEKGRCHTYSYPFTIKRYENVPNNFPGEIFKCVREVSLFDERPFEHEYFLLISQAFPFMNKLSVCNKKPQNNKLCNQSKNINQQSSIIEYPHLTHLDLTDAHDDYVEEFLLDTKTSLPNHVHLYAKYKPFEKSNIYFLKQLNTNEVRKSEVCM
jgi:hypothetical protein